jgi:aspartyl-tRNA synthetase
MGWVHRRRNHGHIIFVDLRDRFGLTQVVMDPANNDAPMALAEELRNEFCVAVRGKVIARPEGMVNKGLETGGIEIHVDELKILNRSGVLPFSINQDEKVDAAESLRLKYRYLDLRRAALGGHIVERAKIVSQFRSALESHGFLDIETPFLYKSTPEGAREFLVPARLHPSQFYALPQSPQLFKQALMMSGMDRYYQIVKCFRDEDLRADRQPEFSQVDIEMSYVEQEQVLETIEAVVQTAVNGYRPGAIKGPIRRMQFAEAMEDYGVDKPDLRFDLKLQNLTKIVEKTDFRVFAEAISIGGIVNAIVVPGGAEKFSRKDIDGLTDLVKQHGAKGLAWAKVKAGTGIESWQSPIAKFLADDLVNEINGKLSCKEGDLILFGAGDYDSTKASLGSLRNYLGAHLNLYNPKDLYFLWVIDFPLMEKVNGRWKARHHPFAMPNPEDVDKLDTDPESVRAAAYDLVCNGHEVAGGSIRIHDPDLQRKFFSCLGLSPEDQEEKFGFLLEALSYGAPPHGGIAFGVDRTVMCLLGTDAIRDVIAFPKTQKATCLMTGSPAKVPVEDLRDLHVRVQMPDLTT